MREELQAYLDSHTPEELRAEVDKRESSTMVCLGNGKLVPLSSLHWWQKDSYGWPIELIKGHPYLNILRIIVLNIRKLTG
jgi:hypothetical protein